MPTIQTSTTIAAAPEKVWQVLTDLDSYPEWNPFIIEGSGEVQTGQQLKLRMQPPGGKPMTFRPTVLAAEPSRELRWLGRLILPGIFDGEHWFRLTPEGDGTKLEQGEHFSGLLPRFAGGMLERTEQGFIELNQALKQRAESR